MITRQQRFTGFGPAFFIAFVAFTGFGPSLVAQQYCVSGAITSLPICSSCGFKVGDSVAMTFSAQPASISCVSSAVSSGCGATATFDAQVGARYWAGQNLQLSYSGTVSFQAVGAAGVTDYTRVVLMGSGTLSPAQSPPPPDESLSGTVSLLSFPGNLLVNGTLPAALPLPAAVSSSNSNASFGFSSSAANAAFSYTGQSCAVAPTSPPTIAAGGVVPVYSSSTTIQPGEWVSIYGTNLAAGTATWTGNFPPTLGNTSVTIDGKPAYLWLVSPTQINLQVPDDTKTGSVPVVITTAGGTATSTVTLAPYSPSFLLLDTKHVTGIILRSNGSGAYGGGAYDILGPTGSSLGYPTVAAKAGDSVVLYGVGFGPTNPVVLSGEAFSGAATTTNTVKVLINNVNVVPSFAGLSGAGLYQINLTLPAGLGTGDVPLGASVNTAQTQSTAVISLQ
jgi:uncharacterized protein (TIGR03437 family)